MTLARNSGLWLPPTCSMGPSQWWGAINLGGETAIRTRRNRSLQLRNWEVRKKSKHCAPTAGDLNWCRGPAKPQPTTADSVHARVFGIAEAHAIPLQTATSSRQVTWEPMPLPMEFRLG